MSQDPSRQAAARAEIAAQLEGEELELAGWRQVPTDASACGDEALKTLPHIEQVFVNCRVRSR